MYKSESFKKNVGAAATSENAADFTRSKSVTYYATQLGKGDEIADYSISYNTDNTQTKSYSKFYYGSSSNSNTAAQIDASEIDLAMYKSESFKKNVGAAATS